jgi:GTP-binding protein EngB required for normal cell division
VADSITKPGSITIAPLSPNEPMAIDEIIDAALARCGLLSHTCDPYVTQIKELRSRLAQGRLHLAVLGQFNLGKSTFINALIGLKILPTSVLPITSVPTLISYGQHVTCTVRFFNKKPDLFVRQSLESIVSTLKMYVAEENNPRNQLCVKEVEITCPSPILENGTVLIDTPGFGSTHVHNTQAALDTVVECDAALFLLSTDPPMTQTEVEFLKQVNIYVPRIFFILNKIDLVSSDDLLTVDRFIRQILITQMGYSHDVKLFHVCAARAEKAKKRNNDDVDWAAGHLETVKSEILEFMIREKYYTLSEALNDKFREALDGINSRLNTDIDDYHIPLELLKREHQELTAQADIIRKAMDKELSLIAVEKDAVLKFLTEKIGPLRAQLEEQLFQSLETLVTNSAGNIESLQGFAVAVARIYSDSFLQLLTSLISSINKPVRKAALVHSRELSHISSAARECVSGEKMESGSFYEKLEGTEIPLSGSWQVSQLLGSLDMNFVWIDRFRNRQARISRIREKWGLVISEAIEKDFDSMTAHLQGLIEQSFTGINSVLAGEYQILSTMLKEAVSRKMVAVTNRTDKGSEPVKSLQNLALFFESIRKLLR